MEILDLDKFKGIVIREGDLSTPVFNALMRGGHKNGALDISLRIQVEGGLDAQALAAVTPKGLKELIRGIGERGEQEIQELLLSIHSNKG